MRWLKLTKRVNLVNNTPFFVNLVLLVLCFGLQRATNIGVGTTSAANVTDLDAILKQLLQAKGQHELERMIHSLSNNDNKKENPQAIGDKTTTVAPTKPTPNKTNDTSVTKPPASHSNQKSNSTVAPLNKSKKKIVLDRNKSSFSLEELDEVLKIDSVKDCGRVPLYQKLYGRSINETFNKNPQAEDDDAQFRILKGLDSVTGEWPWIVRISICDAEEDCSQCTGTLLNRRWIITAGHCGGSDIKKYKAEFALYDLVSPDKISFTRKFDKLIVHPEYHELNNDVMLARLDKPIYFNDYIQPACFLPATRNVIRYARNKKCYSVGYGLTDGMEDALRLQKIQIAAKLPNECNSDKLGLVQLKRGSLCVGPPAGHIGGSCKGDSGGPDLCYDPGRNSWVLIGTVSYGPSVCDRTEGDKWHTVSTDLSNYRTWILTTILKNS